MVVIPYPHSSSGHATGHPLYHSIDYPYRTHLIFARVRGPFPMHFPPRPSTVLRVSLLPVMVLSVIAFDCFFVRLSDT